MLKELPRTLGLSATASESRLPVQWKTRNVNELKCSATLLRVTFYGLYKSSLITDGAHDGHEGAIARKRR